ncbi:MAG: hypothetical protein U0800_17320 [Isosphaeraceae bacterium]
MARKSGRAKAEPPVALGDEEVRLRLLERIRGQDAAATVAAILKGLDKTLGRSKADLIGLLEGLHASGEIHRHGTPKTPKYHHESPAAMIGRSIVAAASGPTGMTWADLKKRPVLKKDIKLVPARQGEAIRDELVREGRIYLWPRTTPKGAERFSTSPPDPVEYLGPLLDQFRGQLKALAGRFPAGLVTADRLERAAGQALLKLGEARPVDPGPPGSAGDPALQILDAMRRADPATSSGAPITFDRLRPLLAGPLAGKAAFDEAVLRLGMQGLVSLHRHDFPAGQSEAEREQMVPDGRGGYYVTISRRAAP